MAGDIIQQNAISREILLRTAFRQQKTIATVSDGQPGTTTRFKINNVGILTGIMLKVSAVLNIGTATATPSPMAPFNLISRVRVADYDGTDRINANGIQLFMLNCLRAKTYWGYNNEAAAAVISNPVISTAVGATQPLSFYLYLPLAVDPQRDLRGALNCQTATGDAFVSIDWNPLLLSSGNADAVYTNASGTVALVGNITVQAYQQYLYPQAANDGKVYLPVVDLLTVHEIAGALRSSDNIVTGSEKLVNYPNLRQVIGAYFNHVDGGAMGAFVDQVRYVLNGNNVIREYPGDLLQFLMRQQIGSDLRAGLYFLDHSDQPVNTAQYGNVQLGFRPTRASAGNTYFGICFESLYPKGALLPGMVQGA